MHNFIYANIWLNTWGHFCPRSSFDLFSISLTFCGFLSFLCSTGQLRSKLLQGNSTPGDLPWSQKLCRVGRDQSPSEEAQTITSTCSTCSTGTTSGLRVKEHHFTLFKPLKPSVEKPMGSSAFSEKFWEYWHSMRGVKLFTTSRHALLDLLSFLCMSAPTNSTLCVAQSPSF